MIRGATQEEAEARIAERRRINKEAEKIVGKPIHAWPLFAMEWDTHHRLIIFHRTALIMKPSTVQTLP
jgi:hypothetical protein